MPPKKRVAEGEDSTNGGASSTDLRRSTRGGGHKAAEPVSKPAKAPASKSKKAKTEAAAKDGDDNSKTAVDEEDKKNGDDKPAEVEEPAATEATTTDSADKIVADAEKDADKTGVEVPEENKEAAEAKEGKRIEVGETIPEGIVLKNEKDEEVNISDITKEKGAVLFVYPKANTPGCTNQACLFRDHYEEFAPLGYEVYGLSSDSPKAQASWKEKNNFQYSFLCDPGQILLKLLGASKGPKSNQRSHYIIAKGGKLVDAKYTVSPKDSVKLALEYIKSQQ